jgi:hypothetical protein
MMKGKSMDKRHTMVVGLAISVMLSRSCPVLAHGPKHEHKHLGNHQTTTGATSST